MGKVFSSYKLTDFQKEKLVHEFNTFYDIDGDGFVTEGDFRKATEFIRALNNWEESSEKAKQSKKALKSIWESLQSVADKDTDGRISQVEWLSMWERVYKTLFEGLAMGDKPQLEQLPMWCYRYFVYRFNMLDRTGDGVLDADEYEYVMTQFKVSPPKAQKAFLIFSDNNASKVDFRTFSELACDYYFSNDPSARGNFITGKMDWTCVAPIVNG